MDKHKYPAKYKNQKVEPDPFQTSFGLMGKEGYSRSDGLHVQEYTAAKGLILEVCERLLEDIAADRRTESTTGLTVEAAEVKSPSQTVSTQQDASDSSISEASSLVNHDDPKSSNQDLLRRFSLLSERLNHQLAGLQATNERVSKATDQLSDSVEYLAGGLGKIKDDLHSVKLKPFPES